jgi:hypothetical protein
MKFKRLLEGYCNEVSVETDRYHPFVQLANHILARDIHSHLVFVPTDRSFLWSSYAKRKSDVLFIFREALGLGERGDEDNLSERGPLEGDEFHYGEPLGLWEFKPKLKKYGRSQEIRVAGKCLLTTTITWLTLQYRRTKTLQKTSNQWDPH